MNKLCSSCVHFDALRKVCRAHPPKPMETGHSFWPEVSDDDWCGEFREGLDGERGADHIDAGAIRKYLVGP